MSAGDIGKEMVAQSNRMTQYVMFAIQIDKRVYMPHSYMWDYDGSERLDSDHQEIEVHHLCDSCKKIASGGEDGPLEHYYELENECDDCHSDGFNWYKIEEVFEPNGLLFFTAKAAQQHIDENKHHYANPKVYGVSAWRNPEMVAVQQHLIKLAGEKVPSHYA